MRSLGEAAGLRRGTLRLAVQTGALVMASLVVLGGVLLLLFEHVENRAADRLLVQTTSRVDSPSEAPPSVHVVIVAPGGRRTGAGMPAGFPDEAALAAVARDGRTRQSDIDGPHGDYTVRTVKRGDRVVQAVLDRHDLEAQRSRLVTALLFSGLLGLVLAGLLGAWLAQRAMRPMARTIALQRRFVADASHELRTPLTLLSTRVQLLARRVRRGAAAGGPTYPALEQDLAGVLADTRMLTDILEELLVAADTRSEVREPVDLVALVGGCTAAADASAQQRGLALAVRLPAGEVLVEGRSAALRRAVTALVDNALDHARSRVEVAVLPTGRQVRVQVLDDGPGIPPEVAPRLFERFTSSRPEPTGARRHYGLGLALVAEVAAAHHGRVTAGSRPDGASGAALTLVLPRGA